MKLTKNQTIFVTISSIVGAIIVSVLIFIYSKPGVFFPYKCDLEGDSSRKFYGDDFVARGAVCEGLYIPFGTKTNGKNTTRILHQMGAWVGTGAKPKPTNKQQMLDLANDAAQVV